MLYLKAPDGLGKSVFANLIPRTLKVPGTARNRKITTVEDLAWAETLLQRESPE